MIKHKITYNKKTHAIKTYKEYIDNVLIKTEYYDQHGNLYKIKGMDETNQNHTYIENYKNGQLHGTSKEWYPNGILKEIYIHKNNKIIKTITYDILGNVKETKNYSIKFI